MEKVCIIGIGTTNYTSISPHQSYREMIFEAARKAYFDAGIKPENVDTFITVAEDYLEGTAIFDEYTPDQLGAVLKPMQTICADGITGIASAVMQLQTSNFEIALIEGHSKASNIVYPAHIEALALDPVFLRPLNLNPKFIAGLEMNAYLSENKLSPKDAARVVVKNKKNALLNSRGSAAASRICIGDVLHSEEVSSPLKELDIAPFADGAIVIILAKESVAKKICKNLVYVLGIGWCEESPNLESRNLAKATYAELATKIALKQAKINLKQIDFAEVDDTFSYKELQHLSAIGFGKNGSVAAMLAEGYFNTDGELPVNVSGGNLGCGYLYDASSLRSVYETCLQLRQQAGQMQLKKAEIALVQSWRGVPTAFGATLILGKE